MPVEIHYNSVTKILQYTIHEKVNLKFVEKVLTFQRGLKKGEKVKILALENGFKGYTSMNALRKAISLDFGWIGKAEKYALVSNKAWLRSVVFCLNIFVFGIKFRAFQYSELSLAKNWLMT